MKLTKIGLIIQLIIVAILLIAPVGIVLASYNMTITVTNDSATAYDMVGVNITSNVDYWESEGFIGTGGTDVRMTSGGSNVPFMLTDGRIMLATTLPAYGTDTVTMTTENTAQDFQIVPGYGGYITVTDAANLELGNDFAITIDGAWIDTNSGASKYVLRKQNAIEILIDSVTDGTVNATLPQYNYSASNLIPNAAGDYTNLTPSAGSNYACVDDTPGAPDDDTTYVQYNNTPMVYDAYNLSTFTIPDGAIISSVQVFFRGRSTHVSYPGNARIGLRLSGSETLGTLRALTGVGWLEYTETISRPGGGSWSQSDINDLQVIAGLQWSGVAQPRITQVYVIVNYYQPEITATITDVDAGEYNSLIVTANGYDLGLFVDIDNPIIVKNPGFERGDPPDDWNLAGSGATFEQSTTQKVSGTYSGKVTRNGNDCSIGGVIENYSDYAGSTVTLGAWVWASVASRATLYIDDGIGYTISSYHTGGSSWEWITVTRTVDGSASHLYAYGLISGGDTSVYFDNFVFVEGSSLTAPSICPDGVSLEDCSVIDNANNITLFNNDSIVYADNVTIDVAGVEQLYFSPNDLIVDGGATGTLPDRGTDGTNNAGTITFGSNPTNVTGELGSLISDYSVDISPETTQQDIAPVIHTRMIPAAEATKLSSLAARDKILYPFFSAINGLTTPGIPILMMYEIFFLTVTIAVMFVLGRFGHLFIMVIAGLAIMGFATAWGVFDFPLIVLLVLIGAGFLYMQGRSAP